MYVDGTKCIDITDSSLSYGKIGTLSMRGLTHIDNVKVMSPVTPTPAKMAEYYAPLIHSAETRTGNIAYEAQIDSFTFNGEAGQAVIIQMSRESGSLEPEILLYAPNGTEETSVSGVGSTLISNYKLQQSGLYTIVVKDDGGYYTGEYSLSFIKIPSTLSPGIYNPFPANGATITNLNHSFRWDGVASATGYDLYFGEDVITPLEKIGENLSSPEMPFPEMEWDKVFYWHV